MTPGSTSQLLEELKTTTDAVRNQGWISGELGGAGSGLEALGSVSSPLSQLSSVGFGFLTASVSFLEEPFQQLAGDPVSVSSGAQGLQDAGRAVSSIADSYQQSTGPETSGWSGSAAAGYLQTGAELVGGIAALGEASRALAEATAGAGAVVAKTLQEVTTLVQEATGKIIMIMNQALAAAQATFGASIAAAIPQAVQVAVEYGGRITAKMQELLSSAQGLMGHVQSTAAAVAKVTDTISQISARSQQGGGTSDSTTPSGAEQSNQPLSASAALGGEIGGPASTSSAGLSSGASGRPLSAGGAAGVGALGRTPGPGGELGRAAAASGAPSMLAGAPRPTGTAGGPTEHRNKYSGAAGRDTADPAENPPPQREDRRDPPPAYT